MGRRFRRACGFQFPDGTAILNQAKFTAPNTVALPGAALTVVK